MKIIVISGTPGTGKTSVANSISKFANSTIISLNELAISEKFDIKYDNKRQTHVIDTERFLPHLIDIIEDNKKINPDFLIIEGHFSDILPEKYINYVIILRCDPDVLSQRLQERDYSNEKIIENLQSEILGNCANYFIQKKIKLPIFEIDTTNLTVKEVADIIINNIIDESNAEKYLLGKVDWLEKLFQEDRMKEFFNEKE